MAEKNTGRATGPAVIAAIAGVLLGGGIAFAAGALADQSELPSQEQIALTDDDAFLGSVQYGERQH